MNCGGGGGGGGGGGVGAGGGVRGAEREEQALNFQPVYEAHRRVVRTSFSMALTRERGNYVKVFTLCRVNTHF